MDYISHLEDTGQATVTVANAVSWATRPPGMSPIWHSRRLSVARCLARHLSAYDPCCQVPPADLLPVRNSRATPYIYGVGGCRRRYSDGPGYGVVQG
jgi:integrase/recombinase XerD